MKLRPLIRGCAVIFDRSEGVDAARSDAMAYMRCRDDIEPESMEVFVIEPGPNTGGAFVVRGAYAPLVRGFWRAGGWDPVGEAFLQ